MNIPMARGGGPRRRGSGMLADCSPHVRIGLAVAVAALLLLHAWQWGLLGGW